MNPPYFDHVEMFLKQRQGPRKKGIDTNTEGQTQRKRQRHQQKDEVLGHQTVSNTNSENEASIELVERFC